MKILFIVQNIIGRGTYLRAFELAKGLNNLGHSVTLLASSRKIRRSPTVSKSDGIKIITVSDFISGPTQSGWDVSNLISRKKIIKHSHYDIVHGFETRPTVIYPALTLMRKGIPLYLDWADWFGKGGSVEERPNPILRTLLRPVETYYENNFRQLPHGTTVICNTLKERALEFGVKEEQICLLHNGFNTTDWTAIALEQAKNMCRFQSETFLIGYLGSLFPDDAVLMAEAFNLFHDQAPNTKLVHIGSSNYQAHQFINTPSAIVETGPVDFQTMMTHLSACDILWLPLRNTHANLGRFPLKFSNYLSCGRPVVATEVGDIPDFIRKYQTGIITRDTPEGLSTTSVTLLQNPALRKTLGANALKLSQNPEHTWSSRAHKLISFYTEGNKETYET